MPAILAERLELELGDPFAPVGPFSYVEAVRRDEEVAYPQEACEILDGWGLHEFYVPEALGGRLVRLDDLLQLTRVVARRDLTVAIAHAKTFLGASPVWVAGSMAQKREVAELVLARAQIALGYHERDHGSDLMATEVVAIPKDGSLSLCGEKWLINNATRGTAIVVFARTGQGRGPRDFSLVLFDKRKAATSGYRLLPRVETLGARGAEFSGIAFSDAIVPVEQMIGAAGSGLETTLRAFQSTKLIVCAMALGALDAGLELTQRFFTQRELYGRRACDLPTVRRGLGRVVVARTLADVVTRSASRALQVQPAHGRWFSAAAKFVAPTLAMRGIGHLGELLGAQHFVREGFAGGYFQKLLRDARVLPIFHSGPFLNLVTVGMVGLGLLAPPGTETTETSIWSGPPSRSFEPDTASAYTPAQSIPALDFECVPRRGVPPEECELLQQLSQLRDIAHRNLRSAKASLGVGLGESVVFHELCERIVWLVAARCIAAQPGALAQDGDARLRAAFWDAAERAGVMLDRARFGELIDRAVDGLITPLDNG